MLLMSEYYTEIVERVPRVFDLISRSALQVGLFVKACRDSIEALKNSIGSEEKQAYGANWLQALGRGSRNTDCIAHQHGVVGIKITFLTLWQKGGH